MVLNATILWLLVGFVLCGAELVLPTAYVAFMMGVSALIVALLSLIIPHAALQLLLWMICSGLLMFLAPRFFPKHKGIELRDPTEGKTLTAIPPGQTGRVLYEGNSWQARCDDPAQAIAPDQKVYVLRREGTTLVVLPEALLQSDSPHN